VYFQNNKSFFSSCQGKIRQHPGRPHYKKAKGKEKTDDREEQEGTHGYKSQSCYHSGSEDKPL
jgi:hypothetical protein